MNIVLAIVLVVVLGTVGLANAAETIKVIGECSITKTAQFLAYIAISDTEAKQGTVQAFEDQKVYILAKDDNAREYAADLQGFVHYCRGHGREVINNKGIIFIPYDAPGVTCKLFE